jgi:hypothetical protein
MHSPVTLRFAFPDDDAGLARLAALDCALPLALPALVAEVDGELRAALSLVDGRAVADPFHFTGELVDLLRTRAQQLAEPGPRAARRPSRRRRPSPASART